MSKAVYILGGAQTDFAKNYAREGLGIEHMMGEALDKALVQCDLEAGDIESAHVGNFTAELFCQQGQLGGIFASLDPKFSGLPTSRHEAACASGSMAIMAAMAEIEAGRYDLVCVLGVEMMRNISGQEGAKHLSCAAWAGKEWQDADYLWPRAFSDLVDVYSQTFGEVDHRHLSELSKINYANAKRNPNAQTRKWELNDDNYALDDEVNPIIEGHIRRSDCSQVSDGAAVIFLASEAFTKTYIEARDKSLSDVARIKGWGHRTATMLFEDKLKERGTSPYVYPHVNGTISDAFARAEINSVFDLDFIETHDCFTMSEYMAIDHFGITRPGENYQAIEEGILEMGGKLPMNPSGGLIGAGHPVGATGVRMMLDCFKQVTDQADSYQVFGAKQGAMLNLGGSATTLASFVVAGGK